MKTKLNYTIKSVALFLMFTSTVFSQNITNKLGTNGLFTIKDSATNYLTLSQSTGQVNILKNLSLENTTGSGKGVIFKINERFLHDFGPDNIFLGINSGNFTLTGARYNIGIGQSTLQSLTNGFYNTAVGYQSLHHNTSGSRNTALGYDALYLNTTGNYNTGLGYLALVSNTTGNNNTALGYEALVSNTTGSSNMALGYLSLNSNTIGGFNTASGIQSLNSNTTGNYNTALGHNSLYANISGTHNTALGYSTGSSVTTGDNLTLVGHNAEPTSGSVNNQITLGNNQITSLRCNVQTITSLSDKRDKNNIKDLSLGLDFLMKVKPRIFNWDKREWYENNISDGSKTSKSPTAGFIAQELDEVQTSENAEWLNLVLKDNPEKIEASYGNLLPVMVKAIQELKEENNMLKQNNENLISEVQSLRTMNGKIIKLEQMVNEMASDKSNVERIVSISGGAK